MEKKDRDNKIDKYYELISLTFFYPFHLFPFLSFFLKKTKCSEIAAIEAVTPQLNWHARLDEE